MYLGLIFLFMIAVAPILPDKLIFLSKLKVTDGGPHQDRLQVFLDPVPGRMEGAPFPASAVPTPQQATIEGFPPLHDDHDIPQADPVGGTLEAEPPVGSPHGFEDSSRTQHLKDFCQVRSRQTEFR